MTSSKKQSAKADVDAFQAVYVALSPLDEAARLRVVRSVLSLLGASPVGQVTIPSANISTEGSSPPALLASRKLSVVELSQEKRPATNAQRIALYAYYREKYEGEGRFSRAQLKTYFSKAKDPAPGNYDRDFSDAVRSGWIHEDGAESYLTSKGLEAVEAGFAGKAKPRGSSTSKRAKSSKKS